MPRIFKEKLFQRFLLTYLLVLILPIAVIGIFNVAYNSKELQNNAYEASLQNLQRTGSLLDREFSELREISLQIGADSDIRKIMFEQDSIEWEYSRWKTLSELQRINAYKQFPTEIMVYFQRTQEFLNSTSFYDVNLFMQNYPLDGADPADFLSQVENNKAAFSTISTNSGRMFYLLYSYGIPRNEGSFSGTVISLIGWDKIAGMFSGDYGESAEKYDYLIGQDGSLLYSSDTRGSDFSDDIIRILPTGRNSMVTEERLKNDTYLVTAVRSELFPVWYVSLTQMKDVLQSVLAMRFNLFLTVAICIVSGVIIILIISRRNYEPIQGLMEYAESGDEAAQQKAAKGFGTVVNRLDALFSQTKKLEESIQLQRPNMRQSFISNLLSGLYPADDDLTSLQEMVGVRFESEKFAVVITSIDSEEMVNGSQDEKTISLLSFSVTNVMKELMDDIALVEEISQRRRTTYLLNFKEDVLDPMSEMERRVDEAHRFIVNTFHEQLSVGVSSVCEGIDNILSCNEQAQEALNQRFLYGTGLLSVFNEEDLQLTNRYYYPMDIETRIINFIKQGNADAAGSLVDQLFEENLQIRHISLQLSYCMSFNLIGTILKVLNETGIDYDMSGYMANMLNTMMQQGTIWQLKDQIHSIIGDICNIVTSSRESGNVQLKKRVLEYLDGNYPDSNLSLMWVADQFHLSGPYLSRYFKDQIGMNFADYLCRLRIARSKELMENPELSVVEIAEKVGYNSSNSFIRTFKRYEGITPGQYREQLGETQV